jgi:hypothetical protein
MQIPEGCDLKRLAYDFEDQMCNFQYRQGPITDR